MNKSFTFSVCQKIKEAWSLYKGNLGVMLLFTLITLIVSSIGQDDNFLLSLIIMFFNFLISFIWIRSVLDLIQEGEFRPFTKKVLPSLREYWHFISTAFLSTLIIIIGIILLIVPGLYISGRIMFACYIAIDKNKNAIDAIKESWNMTKGYGWKMFWKSFVIGLFVLLGLIAIFIGLFITYPIGILVMIMLYREFYKFSKEGVKESIVEETITIIQEEGSPVVEVIDEKITKVSE